MIPKNQFYLALLLVALLTYACFASEDSQHSPNVSQVSRSRTEFIRQVRPLEFSSLSKELFEKDESEKYLSENPSIVGIPIFSDLRSELGHDSNICIRLSLSTLGTVNDDFTTLEKFQDRIKLSVDGPRLFTMTGAGDFAPANLERVIYEDGEYLYSGPHDICWEAELEEGIHVVTFEFHQTNGTICTYSWYFELT